jgi:hypothetical protein
MRHLNFRFLLKNFVFLFFENSWFESNFKNNILHTRRGKARRICLGGDKGYYDVDPDKLCEGAVLLTASAVAAADVAGTRRA